MLTNTEDIKRLLYALEEKMGISGCAPIGLVVCGGAALNILGIVSRTTMDIDVLAAIHHGRMEQAKTLFTGTMLKCIEDVAKDFGAPKKWLNPGPGNLFEKGLPNGITERLCRESFGRHLDVYWISRFDLICLKLYAAADDVTRTRRDVDIQDLHKMQPQHEEIDKAILWMRTLYDYEEKKIVLEDVLRDLGYDDLGYYL